MMRFGRGAAALSLLCAMAGFTIAAPAATAATNGPGGSLALPTSIEPPVVGRQLVVVFRDGVTSRAARSLHRSVGADAEGRASSLGVDVVRIPRGRSVAAAMRRYAADPRVASVEPNLRRFPSLIPSDALFRHQWSMRNTGQNHAASFGGSHRGRSGADIDANEAWEATTGEVADPADRVVIAVIDDGVDLDHPDLAGEIWVNEDETPGDGMDDDGNGFADDVNGWDFDGKDPNPNPLRQDSHGTHIAGVIAAEHDGGGIAGLCPNCRIMPLRFGFTVAQEVRAVEYAVENGATVINMSFGGPVWSAAERAAIDAAGDAGVLVVASAGNESLDNDTSVFMTNRDASPAFPASYDLPELVSVAASNDRDVYGYGSFCDRRGLPSWVCAFTSWGRVAVDVAAPGVDVVSSVVAGTGGGGVGADHEAWDGTSMAAPHVSGIAALVRTVRPELAPVEVKNAIMNGVDRPSSLQLSSYHHEQLGIPAGPLSGRFTQTQGRVNALAALTADASQGTSSGDGTIRGAGSMRRSAAGHVGWPGDVNDVYAKRLRASSRYEVSVDGRGGADLDLFVWNPGTQDVWQFDAGCFHVKGRCLALRASSTTPRADETATFRTGKAGTYYIHVSAWFSGARYRLDVRRL
jgi:subtilisin family serine protease